MELIEIDGDRLLMSHVKLYALISLYGYEFHMGFVSKQAFPLLWNGGWASITTESEKNSTFWSFVGEA